MILARVQRSVPSCGPWRAAGGVRQSRLVGLLVSLAPVNPVQPDSSKATKRLLHTSVLSSPAWDLTHQRESRRMESTFLQRYEGPISGLRLPLKAWDVLRRQNITTMDQLQAAADRVHWFDGIGLEAARLIRGGTGAGLLMSRTEWIPRTCASRASRSRCLSLPR
jgi:hypothetical protein